MEHEDMVRERGFRRDLELDGEFRVPLLELKAASRSQHSFAERRSKRRTVVARRGFVPAKSTAEV